MDRIRPTDTTEERIENMTDPEASAIFREAFYAEAKALEKEALAHPVEVDEEQMEALRRRILQSVGAEEDDIEALEKEPEDVPERTEAVKAPMSKDASSMEMTERKYSMETSEEIALGGILKKVYSMGASEAEDSEETLAKAYTAHKKRKKPRLSPLARWAAVLALACVGVLGVSMTSQAKGSGLWSSIQRLIGKEVRWDQEDNGEDRSFSNPDEYKAIGNIEDELQIDLPEFFWWPGEMMFSDYEIFQESGSFMMIYMKDGVPIYFEGWKGDEDASANYEWEGEGKTTQQQIDGVLYNITTAGSDNEDYNRYYYVTWKVGDSKFMLSGEKDFDELQKILKNIKN